MNKINYKVSSQIILISKLSVFPSCFFIFCKNFSVGFRVFDSLRRIDCSARIRSIWFSRIKIIFKDILSAQRFLIEAIIDSYHVRAIKIAQCETFLLHFGSLRRLTFRGYSRTNRLLIKVAGTQNTITRTSAIARFAMKRFVGVRIRGTRKTTEMTNRLPMRPTLNTKK